MKVQRRNFRSRGTAKNNLSLLDPLQLATRESVGRQQSPIKLAIISGSDVHIRAARRDKDRGTPPQPSDISSFGKSGNSRVEPIGQFSTHAGCIDLYYSTKYSIRRRAKTFERPTSRFFFFFFFFAFQLERVSRKFLRRT